MTSLDALIAWVAMMDAADSDDDENVIPAMNDALRVWAERVNTQDDEVMFVVRALVEATVMLEEEEESRKKVERSLVKVQHGKMGSRIPTKKHYEPPKKKSRLGSAKTVKNVKKRVKKDGAKKDTVDKVKGSAGSSAEAKNGKRSSRIITKPRKFDDYVELSKKKPRSNSDNTDKNDSQAEFDVADDNLEQSFKSDIEDESDQSGDEIIAATSKVNKGVRPAKAVVSKQLTNKEPNGKKKEKMAAFIVRRNGTKLDCPECEFGTFSVMSWIFHLRHSHSTTPTKSGLVLHCECGQYCHSAGHSVTCNISNFTVVRKDNLALHRLDDAKATPQCVMCENYPNTISSYYWHLARVHHISLINAKIYLLCNCGKKIVTRDSLKSHSKTCDGRQFTLHKIAKN